MSDHIARELLAVAEELTDEQHRFVMTPMKRARTKAHDAARAFDKKNYRACLALCRETKKWLDVVIANLE